MVFRKLKWKIYGKEIKKLYFDRLKSPADIAAIYGFRRESVKNAIARYYKLRSQSEAAKLAVSQGKKEKAIKLLIHSAKTTNRFNPAKSHFGEKNPRWLPFGSKRIAHKNDGTYIVIKVRDKGKWIYEHRYIISQQLGRKLKSSEIVHHINGNTLDNRLENLLLTNKHQHRRLRYGSFSFGKAA